MYFLTYSFEFSNNFKHACIAPNVNCPPALCSAPAGHPGLLLILPGLIQMDVFRSRGGGGEAAARSSLDGRYTVVAQVVPVWGI